MNRFQKAIMRSLTGSSDDPNLDDLLNRADALIAAVAPAPLHSGAGSRTRHSFAGGNPMEHMNFRRFVRYLPAGFSEVSSFLKSMRLIRKRKRGSITITSRASIGNLITTELKRLGATSWGYTLIPEHAVFAGKIAPLPGAIVFTGYMDATVLRKAPAFEVLPEVAGAYGRVGAMANRLTQYLRALGIDALPGHPLGGQTDYPLLGELAGLGRIGRNGLLISPANGPCQRIGVVYVGSMELGWAATEDHTWIDDFCTSCGQCGRRCPVGAIDAGIGQAAPGRFHSANGDRCLPYFHANWGCSVCVAVCPFTTVGYAQIKTTWERRKTNKSDAMRGE